MKKLSLFNLLIITVLIQLGAQVPSGTDLLNKLTEERFEQGKIDIYLDEGIEENYFKHLISNSQKPEVLGYRIRIFSGSGHDAKSRASESRARFLSSFPEVGAYLSYDAPDYKVYVGDCRTRSEVLELFDRIKSEFPNAFIPPRQAINPEKYKSTVE